MGTMTAFADELVKLAFGAPELGKKVLPALKRFGPGAALVGGGALTYHLGSKELEKYRLGRQVYDQMQAREGQ